MKQPIVPTLEQNRSTWHIDQILDLSGLRCPLPVLRTKKALFSLTEGQVIKVISTDPSSVTDLPSYAKMAGHELLDMQATPTGHYFILRK